MRIPGNGNFLCLVILPFVILSGAKNLLKATSEHVRPLCISKKILRSAQNDKSIYAFTVRLCFEYLQHDNHYSGPFSILFPFIAVLIA